MESLISALFLSLLLLVCFPATTLATSSSRGRASPPAVKAAYWPSWADTLPPSAVNTNLFTHVYYAFLMPNNVTFNFNVDNSTALQLSNFTTTLRHKNPPVKTLLSIGGGGADTSVFVRMASQPKSREAFIYSSMEVARKFGFDGVDMDWEYPENPKEMRQLGLLLGEWRLAIEAEAKDTCRPALLFTAAVYFSVDFFVDIIYRKYPVESMKRNLDWMNAMCFDYHGGWDKTATGSHATLYDPKSNLSTSYGLKSWLDAGVPRAKLVMGLPLYGRSWELKDPNSHEIGSPAVDVGLGEEGFIPFAQVAQFNRINGATVVDDVEGMSTYSYAGSTWIGYDDEFSATIKIGFAQALGLRGYFFWALSYDYEWKISTQASRAWIRND